MAEAAQQKQKQQQQKGKGEQGGQQGAAAFCLWFMSGWALAFFQACGSSCKVRAPLLPRANDSSSATDGLAAQSQAAPSVGSTTSSRQQGCQ